MVRKVCGLLVVALALCAGAVLAEEVKGKVTKADADKHTITVSVDGKEKDMTVADDCKMPAGREGKAMDLKGLAKMLDNPRVKENGGLAVTLKTDKKDGKEVVTEIQMSGRGKKKEGDKKKDDK